MTTIPLADAIAAVRKNLDEQGLNESVMYTDENGDNSSMDSVIAKTLPEAINEIHRIAPVYLLEGDIVGASAILNCSVNDGVLQFTLDDTCIRLAAFRAADSSIVVTDVIPEASAEGRKQLNKYIRGTYDNPKLVKIQGKGGPMTFRYYSLKDDSFKDTPAAAVGNLQVIKQQSYSAEATGYPASTELVDSIIYHLTAMVLAIYKDADSANYFFQKALKWKTS